MASRLPIPGSDDGSWGDILNAYLEVSHASNGTLNSSVVGTSQIQDNAVTNAQLDATSQTLLAKANSSVQNVNGKAGNSVTLAASDVSALPNTTKLSELSDTGGLTSVTDSQVLSYDGTSHQWVPATVASNTVSDATTSSKGLVALSGDIGGTAITPTVTNTHLASALPVNQGGTGSVTQNFTDLSSDQTVGGNKTFSGNTTFATITSASAYSATGITGTGVARFVGGVASGAPVTGSFNLGDFVIDKTGKVWICTTAGSPGTWTTTAAGVTLDPTSSDIHPLGTQAAGSIGKAADAGHVHAMPRLDQVSSPTVSVSLNSQKITSLANGTASTDAAAFGQIPVAGTTSSTYAAGNDSRITNAAKGLTPTAVKTSTYTAAVSDFVPVDTSAGSVAVTLPTAPTDKSSIGIKMINVSGSNTVTINAGGSDVFNKAGGSTALTLSLLNQGVLLQYASSTAIWYVQDDDLPLPQLDSRYVGQTSLGAASGIATLNGSSQLTSSQLPSSALVYAGVDHVDVNGNSYVFGGPPGTMWTDNWSEIAANMLGARTRRNIGYSGSSACHSDNSAGEHGGWSWVLQNLMIPGMPSVNATRQYPYLPTSKLAMAEDGFNDLANLGHLNPTPYLHGHRTILAARSLAAIYLASGADTVFGTAADAAMVFTGTWSVTAGGGTTPTTATHDTHANAGTGYRATTTVNDHLTYTVASDAVTGRVHDVCIPVAQADDIVVTVTVAGTSYGTVHLQGATICDPAAANSAYLNGYTMRIGSSGPTDPTAGAHALAPGDTIVITLTTKTAGSLKISHCGIEADPLDGPLFVAMTANRMPSGVGYSLWNSFPHGPSAGTDPLNDAAVLSWITSQQTMEQAEFPNVVSLNADTVLNQNAVYWGDGGIHVNTNPHVNASGNRALGRAVARAVLSSTLLTDRMRTSAKVIDRSFFLRVGTESVSEASFQNGWKNSNFAGFFETQPLGFTVDMNGRVTIHGVLDASAATAATIFAMPEDLRPPGVQVIYFAARYTTGGASSAGLVSVFGTDGTVTLDAPATGVIGTTNATVSFEGSYQVER